MASYRDLDTPGDIIGQRRKELHMTQTEIARKMGYRNPNFLSMMESGTSRVPLERCQEIADILEMDQIWFLQRVLADHFPGVASTLFAVESLERMLADARRRQTGSTP
ncbi:transcriptional regulator with XRE-family HTH domain [Azospirillum fermentarium]|uniref:helix-turn-helix domain-containing protein n=1 Tax=Azospirillum fermentarium TaxID=1233114 RepID=UPI002226DA8F|nr:helix-turn-helix transcriptional regulator [Azospirillum fermentarium]MCW2248519.1 transcriptional regulator with XRE-family HTH domain [Azospirillum fermentarium]